MKKVCSLLLLTALLAGCTGSPSPKNDEDLSGYVLDHDFRICTLNMSAYQSKYANLPSFTATMLRVEDRLKAEEDQWAIPAEGYKEFHENKIRGIAALILKNVESTDLDYVNKTYDELLSGEPKFDDLDPLVSVTKQLVYWSDAYEKAYSWGGSPKAKLCIVTEQNGRVRAHARELLLDALDKGDVDIADDASLTIIRDTSNFNTQPKIFLNTILGHAQELESIPENLAYAIYMGRWHRSINFALDNDPDDQHEFILQYEAEVAAAVDALDSKSYASDRDEVLDRSDLGFKHEKLWEAIRFRENFQLTPNQKPIRETAERIRMNISASNTRALNDILDRDTSWINDNGYHNFPNRFAGIVNRSDDIEFIKRGARLLEEHIAISPSQKNYAEIIDKIEIAEGREQIYGTQGECTSTTEFIQLPTSMSKEAVQKREALNVDSVTENSNGWTMACLYK